jgi:hypothetical protein
LNKLIQFSGIRSNGHHVCTVIRHSITIISSSIYINCKYSMSK